MRLDYLDNTQGVQYIGKTNVVSGTMTGVIKIDQEHLLIKPEVRFDKYKQYEYEGDPQFNIQQFQDSKGNYTKPFQITFGIAMIYKY